MFPLAQFNFSEAVNFAPPDRLPFGLDCARRLGQDELVKHVFLQLLDAVEYSHSLGIIIGT